MRFLSRRVAPAAVLLAFAAACGGDSPTSPSAFNPVLIGSGPASIVLVSGDNQSGVEGTQAPAPVVVRVVDRNGTPVGNIPVTFTPGTGSGTVSGATVQSDATTGTATLANWTFGTSASQTLVVTSPSVPGKSLTVRAQVAVSQYNIDVRFVGDGGTARQREAFSKAVSRWRRVIMGDIGATTLNAPAGECASWLPAIKETLNDLVIYVRLTSIDGAGKTLGQASPCYVNSTNKLPVLGFFELDVDDLTGLNNNGTLDDVVLHEMGHILGIGTLWSHQRTLLAGRGSEDPYFTGTTARSRFSSIPGNSYSGLPVPVENSGGTGTRDSHWRRSVFGNELMQGYVQGGGMPLSAVTIGSLADLGYSVSYASANSFSFLAAVLAESAPLGTAVSFGDDIADSPLWEVSPSGDRRLVRSGTAER
ncbi:MAG: leishmanolysin-related zinc metalloendopeptidase [Gemmatimonadota bacterium]